MSNYNTNSTWYNNTLSCEIPTDLNFLVVYSKAGGKNSPQNYIVSAVSNYTYQNISFIDSENTHRSYISNFTQIDNPLLDNYTPRNLTGISNITENIVKDYFKEVTFRLNIDFMELRESDFAATKKDFSFRKYFDFNLTNPFGS